MLRKIQYCILIVSISLITGCISDFKVNLPETNEGILVVEGYILENSQCQFSFSKSFSMSEKSPPEGFDEVEVNLYIVGDNGYRSGPASYLGKGVHQIKVGQLDDNISYGIEFEYDGETYHSSLTKPVYTTEIDSVSWTQSQEYGDISIYVSTHNDNEEISYFIWKYVEDWEFKAKFWVTVLYDLGGWFYLDPSAPKYYCWNRYEGHDILVASTEKLRENRITNHKLYNRPSSHNRFSMLYSTRVYQRGLSKAAYEYYLDLLRSNEEMGGLFSPLPSGIEGNIICTSDQSKKVIGFIDVSKNTAEAQLYINNNEITWKAPYMDCPMLTNDSISNLMKDLQVDMHRLIESGWHPLLSSLDEPRNAWVWTFTQCLDCTLTGGTKDKPDFWPNDHN